MQQQRINAPYGDIFFSATPRIDDVAQRLHAEQKQRELQHQQQLAALDNEFSRNVSGIRDADVDDFTNLYGNYKAATKATMKKKDGVSPQEQLEVLRKKADLYKLINESKAEKEREETIAKRYGVKPDDFNDNAGELLITGRKLPLSKKRQYTVTGADGKTTTIDLSNPENYLYQDKTNWQPILNKAFGTLTPRGATVIKPVPGGLEEDQITYKAGNSPVEVAENIYGSFTKARDDQNFANRFQFSPEEAQNITLAFDELSKNPEFKNVYGDIKFRDSMNLTPGGRAAILLAKKNALENLPVASAPKRVPIKSAIMDRQFGEWKQKNAITFGQSLQKIAANRQNATSGYNETSGNAFDEITGIETNGGKKIIDGTVYNADGTLYTSPSGNGDIFIPKNRIPSSMLTALEASGIKSIGDGVNVIVRDGVIVGAETKRNGIVSRQNMENYQKKFNTEPQKGAQPQFGKPVNAPQQPKSTYKPVAPVLTHTKDEFLKAGWSEDEIKKAVKAGKIKVSQ